jgi:hypothetical protein
VVIERPAKRTAGDSELWQPEQIHPGHLEARAIEADQASRMRQIQLSNIHFGRIVTHLVKPSAALSESEADAMPVKPTGVGGNDVAHTRAIVDMRKTHPVFSVLLAAF